MINNINEIVETHNDFTSLALKGFNAVEMDMLMAICAKCRDKGTGPIDFTFGQIIELTHYSKANYSRFVGDLKQTNKKLNSLNIEVSSEGRHSLFTLFPTFVIDENTRTLSVSVNPEFLYVLNDLSKNFTNYSLEEFSGLSSTYSKLAYRRLKQFKHTGVWHCTADEFREYMDIPPTYRESDINKRVLSVIQSELSPFFSELRIDKIKSGKRGRRVEAYLFTFKKKTRGEDEVQGDLEETNRVCPHCGRILYRVKGEGRLIHSRVQLEIAPCEANFKSVIELIKEKKKMGQN